MFNLRRLALPLALVPMVLCGAGLASVAHSQESAFEIPEAVSLPAAASLAELDDAALEAELCSAVDGVGDSAIAQTAGALAAQAPAQAARFASTLAGCRPEAAVAIAVAAAEAAPEQAPAIAAQVALKVPDAVESIYTAVVGVVPASEDAVSAAILNTLPPELLEGVVLMAPDLVPGAPIDFDAFRTQGRERAIDTGSIFSAPTEPVSATLPPQ